MEEEEEVRKKRKECGREKGEAENMEKKNKERVPLVNLASL